MVDVANALAYLHSRIPPLMHRDLSPSNIMIKPSPSNVMTAIDGMIKSSPTIAAAAATAVGGADGVRPIVGPATAPVATPAAFSATVMDFGQAKPSIALGER